MPKRTQLENDAGHEHITQPEEEVIYTALGSQVRREIIAFIEEKEKVGFVDLKQKFDLKVGSLYHQLNSMKELITQDDEKKYFLSDLGKVAFKLMIINKDQIETANVKLMKETNESSKETFFEKLWDIIVFMFLPRKVFKYLASETLRTFFEGLLIIGLMIFFSIDSAIVLVGFYPLTTDFWYFSVLGVIGLWIFIALMTELLYALFYKRKYNPLKLIATIPFALLPNMIALFFIWLQTKVSTTFLFLEGQLLLILAQIWSLSLTTTAVSQSKELAMKRSSLVVLFTFYFTYIIAFIALGVN